MDERYKTGRGALLACTLLIGAVLLLATFPSATAANDPGHDSLYVLLTGDSNIVGNLNISNRLNASNLKFATLLYGDYLDVRANGSIYIPSSRPAIQADTNDLYLDSLANVYIATRAGTTGRVQIGPTTGSGITLNVSGTILQQNVRVCLANGSNCASGNNTGNVSTVTAGSGLANSGTAADPVLDVTAGDGLAISADQVIINNASVCRTDGVGCPAGATAGVGWTNGSGSGNVSLTNSNVNVSLNTLFVDNTNNRIGVGTPQPNSKLHVNGSVNVSGTSANLNIQDGVLQTAGTTRISNAGVGSFATGTTVNALGICLADGTNCIVSNTNAGGGWLNGTNQVHLANNATNVSVGYYVAYATPVLFVDNTNARVGVGVNTPTAKLTVVGTMATGISNPFVLNVTGGVGGAGLPGEGILLLGGIGGFGSGIGGGKGGLINITAGLGGNDDTVAGGAGGDIYLSAGDGREGTGGGADGGNIYLAAGTASSTGTTNGSIIIRRGGLGILTTPSYPLHISEYTQVARQLAGFAYGAVNLTGDVSTVSINSAANGSIADNAMRSIIATTSLDTTGNGSGTISSGHFQTLSYAHAPKGIGEIRGVVALARNMQNGTVTTMYGTYASADNQNGTVTNQYGSFARAYTQYAGATTTNAYGYYGQIFENGGAIASGYVFRGACGGADTCYGLYVNDLTGTTTNYSIYTAGTDDINYFAGKVGINTATPANMLNVVGDFNVTGKAYGIAPTMYLTSATQDGNHNCDDTPTNCCDAGYHLCTATEVLEGGREIEDSGTGRDATIYNVAGDVDPLSDNVGVDCTGWSTIGATDDKYQCTITTTISCTVTLSDCVNVDPQWCCSD